MEEYNPQKIEKKWAEVWDKTKLYQTDLKSKKNKHYNLVMFPYPSGEYLHIGHGYSFSGADVYARFKKLNGFNVFEPIGYDSFGLPAENFAIKNKVHPKESTASNIKHAEKQLRSFGTMFDFSKEVVTSDSSYYKWTQWLFLKLYEKGLVYQKESPVNWCPKCLTVLANEQVINGLCERCDTQVVQKNLKQWFFKITDYAERLIKDLDKVDWPGSSVIKQRNWIGRSEGVEFEMDIVGQKEKIKTYTTRIDTVFGMTYVVLAPEHPLVLKITSKENKKAVEDYQIKSQKLSEVDRQLEDREKTGVFTGAYAVNPFNNKKVPVWIADYVIYGYGTGAVMAVPAHDERDFEFAKKYNLPIVESIAPYMKDDPRDDKETEKRDIVTAIVKNPKNNSYLCLNWKTTDWKSFPTGGTDGEDLVKAAKREVGEETGYKNLKFIKQIGDSIFSEFYRPHKDSNVFANFKYLLFELENEEKEVVAQKEKDQHEAVWVKETEVSSFISVWNQKIAWKRYKEGDFAYTDYGVVINSGRFSGLKSEEAKEKMAKWLEDKKLGGKKINYRLRDWSIGRQRYWGAPIPIIYCKKCGVQPVPEKDLPVLLPELPLEKVQPKGTGKGPLANAKEFVKTICPKCGGEAERETDTMDTFVDSSFYFLRYPSVSNNKEMMEKEVTKKWLPVDMYVGGAEHVTMHLLYARFITKALFDQKLIDFDEPFLRLRHQGMILGPDGKKMSKSKGNVVIPDEVIKEYGADTFRTYILFMGPFEDGGPWDPKGIKGIQRFLEKYWELANEVLKNQKPENPEEVIYYSKEIEETALLRIIHKTIKKVSEDIEGFRFNTAVSSFMVCLNEMLKIKSKLPFSKSSVLWKEVLEIFSILLSPFAPFITEEVWERFGNHDSIFTAAWPKYDEGLIEEEVITLVVQINGKVRDTIEVSAGISQKDAQKEALKSQKVIKYTTGKKVANSFFVPNKLINLIVE